MDSLAPNRAAGEWLPAGGLGHWTNLRAEATIGDSRFDFAAEENGRRVVAEVKGCTLEEGGVARFPDAPTLRGLKHVRGLQALAEGGARCVLLVVIQMKGVSLFRPNWQTQPEFGTGASRTPGPRAWKSSPWTAKPRPAWCASTGPWRCGWSNDGKSEARRSASLLTSSFSPPIMKTKRNFAAESRPGRPSPGRRAFECGRDAKRERGSDEKCDDGKGRSYGGVPMRKRAARRTGADCVGAVQNEHCGVRGGGGVRRWAEPSIVSMVPRDRDGQEPPRPVAEAMRTSDVFFCIVSRSITHTSAVKKRRRAMAPADWC